MTAPIPRPIPRTIRTPDWRRRIADPGVEDHALQPVPAAARRWSPAGIASAGVGAASFLACEAIGAALCAAHGLATTAAAIAAAALLMAALSLVITHAAARTGLGIDLLARGAGFGLIGASLASLIHAAFTFLLLAVEASILSGGIALITGLPLWLAHVGSTLLVLGIAARGIGGIGRFQAFTAPLWLALQLAPAVGLVWLARQPGGGLAPPVGTVQLLPFGLCLSAILALLPQVGAQAAALRFLPAARPRRWWPALLVGGPGWAVIAGAKLLLGALLAQFVLGRNGVLPSDLLPAGLFANLYAVLTGNARLALLLTGLLLVVAQARGAAASAYAGSIAWSNFFARLTHAHPGRLVWLAFNAALALLLMEIGVLAVVGRVLTVVAVLACGWIGALAGELALARPLGLVPRGLESRRAHLYDVNPVGTGAMLIGLAAGFGAHAGLAGPLGAAFAPVIGLALAFVAAPALALLTDGRFYLARAPALPAGPLVCVACGGDGPDAAMATCPFVGGTLCSRCCTLEARCRDRCKTGASLGEQGLALAGAVLPARLARRLDSSFGRFVAVMALFTGANAVLLWFIAVQYGAVVPAARPIVEATLLLVFLALAIVSGIAAWLLVLAHDTRRAAEADSDRRTALLLDQIAAQTRAEAALARARDAADLANRAKSRTLAAVSHEIRSPLNAIHGYAQLLERGSSIAPAEAARVIRRSAEHLSGMVDGLLDISSIEGGMVRLSRDLVHLPTLLDGLVEMFRVQAADKGLAFRYEAAPNLPPQVRIDEKRLRQILINLLSNAIKYTPAGEVRLTVRVRSLVAEFAVTDTGLGIRPEDRDRIFEPFDRGGNPDARAQPGTGLGLPLARLLARVMGGELTLDSTAGQGSRFTLRLMLSVPNAGDVAADTPRRRQVTGYSGPVRTILAIDDDADSLAVLQGLLRPLGFAVFVAGGGPAGLELARHCKPDLVLLDVAMPGLSGWDVARRLRDEHGARLGILMVSGNIHDMGERGDSAAAHDGFVAKPVALDSLVEAIGARLGLIWSREPPPPVDEARAPPPPARLPRVPGAGPYIAELRRLGLVGHVRGIDAKLAELADLPGAAPLVDALRAPVRDFDLKTFLKLLDGADAP